MPTAWLVLQAKRPASQSSFHKQQQTIRLSVHAYAQDHQLDHGRGYNLDLLGHGGSKEPRFEEPMAQQTKAKTEKKLHKFKVKRNHVKVATEKKKPKGYPSKKADKNAYLKHVNNAYKPM